VETKHSKTISNKCIAQVIGYYIKARGDISRNRHGVALLINEYKSKIFFLFPFVEQTDVHGVTYGVQSLKLMSYECDFQEVEQLTILWFILLLCLPDYYTQ